MKTIGGYFVNRPDDAIAIKDNIIAGKKFRFTILSDRLVRLEYSKTGTFENRPTQRVIFRKFPKVKFSITTTDTLIQITTSYFTLNYVKDQSFTGGKLSSGSTLKINLNNTDRSWYYHHPNARNFGGINYSLDDFSGNLKLGKGLYSTDGFAELDDSNSYVLNSSSNFVKREEGSVDIYVFMYRKDLGLCLQDYFKLTGYPFLIPRSSLGNWWYKNTKYNNHDIADLVIRFKENNIPLSTILLGDKWHTENDPLAVDTNLIEINSLKQFLNQYRINLGLTITPDYPISSGTVTYQNMVANIPNSGVSYQLMPMDNNKLNLYTTYCFKNFITSGIDAMYIDYNNIKDKNTLSLLTHYDYAMNGMLMNKRGVVLARNHEFAPHKDTIIFIGKTKVDWNTLSILPRYSQAASNNGISYLAFPVGGYYGGIEDFELYIRYIQLGVFSSMLVLGSEDGKYYRREPWRWNISQQEIIKKYLVLRNKLIPYIYTECFIYHQSGSPLIQPLYYKYPKIYDEPNYKNQYFFGSGMLVCPITKKKNIIMNRVVQRMFIPEGTWYELETGKKYLGNKYYMSFYKDEDYPVFCREGSIIVMSLNDTTDNPTDLEVNIFPGKSGEYKLYEDDGITNQYLNNIFSLTEYHFDYTKDNYQLIIENKGSPELIPSVRNYKIRFRNTKKCNVSVASGNTSMQVKATSIKNDFIIDIPNVPTSSPLRIILAGENIENSTLRLINDDIKQILEDLEIETTLKEKIDSILFGTLPIKKKRIAIRKLKRSKLEPKFIKMFLNLLEYIETV